MSKKRGVRRGVVLHSFVMKTIFKISAFRRHTREKLAKQGFSSRRVARRNKTLRSCVKKHAALRVALTDN